MGDCEETYTNGDDTLAHASLIGQNPKFIGERIVIRATRGSTDEWTIGKGRVLVCYLERVKTPNLGLSRNRTITDEAEAVT